MTKHRINPIKVGAKTRFQIQKKVLGFFWDTVMNSLNENLPYEYKVRDKAERKLVELNSK